MGEFETNVPDFDPSVDSHGACPLPDEAANDNNETPPDGGGNQQAA